MKFNLKLLIITFALSSGFAYAAEQKEDFDNEDFQRFFEAKSKKYRAQFRGEDFLREVEIGILNLKPIWYKEWKRQITTNPEEYLFYLFGRLDYNNNIFKSEFDQKIEELIKNKTDINNNKYANGQTLMMKILEKINEAIVLVRIDHLRPNVPEFIRNSSIAQAAKYQKSLSKLIDVLKKVLPNVNDFYVEDNSGKTVFDYAKDNDEVTELLKSALKERKKNIEGLLNTTTPLIPALQGVTLDYLACEK